MRLSQRNKKAVQSGFELWSSTDPKKIKMRSILGSTNLDLRKRTLKEHLSWLTFSLLIVFTAHVVSGEQISSNERYLRKFSPLSLSVVGRKEFGVNWEHVDTRLEKRMKAEMRRMAHDGSLFELIEELNARDKQAHTRPKRQIELRQGSSVYLVDRFISK